MDNAPLGSEKNRQQGALEGWYFEGSLGADLRWNTVSYCTQCTSGNATQHYSNNARYSTIG